MPILTLRMRPVAAPYARLFRRRGMRPPDSWSGKTPAALVPYRFRHFHEWFATSHGYFWIPCPVCGRPFGGHELGDIVPDPASGPGRGKGICPACAAAMNGGRV
jgi:hypothetical protein